MKTTISTLLTICICNSLFAQANRNQREAIQNNLNSSLLNQVPSSAANSGISSTYGNTATDTGAQRPVKIRDTDIIPFIGYDAKITYLSNPLNSSGQLTKLATGKWSHIFSGGTVLGTHDIGEALLIPVIGGNWTSNEYTETELERFNNYTTSAYASLIIDFTNGLKLQSGLSYQMIRNAKKGEDVAVEGEVFSSLSPQFSLSKDITLSSSTSATFSAGLSYLDSESYAQPASDFLPGQSIPTEDQMDNYTTSLSVSLSHRVGKLTIKPTLRSAYNIYDNGQNKSREDWLNTLSVVVDYPVIEDITASLVAGYTNRDSSGTTTNYDYKSWNGGLGLNLSSRF